MPNEVKYYIRTRHGYLWQFVPAYMQVPKQYATAYPTAGAALRIIFKLGWQDLQAKVERQEKDEDFQDSYYDR